MSDIPSSKKRPVDILSWQVIRRTGRLLTPVFFPALWVVVVLDKVVRNVFGHIRKRKKSILLIAQNKIAADHARLIWELLKNDKELEFFVTDDRLYDSQISKSDLSRIIAVRNVNILTALFRFWDLIVYVNHPWGLGIWFAPFIKKVFINHGICTGKINNDHGEDGVYGKARVLRPYSKPLYDKMFATSFLEKKQAIMQTEELRSRIAVTGFLRADLIEKLQKKRDVIRNSLGYTEDDIVVHIISTWGATSLFQTIGEDLLLEATKLANKFRFIFSLHPRHDEFGDVKKRTRQDILDTYELQGIRAQTKLEWDECVVASDIAVSDHSSLCLYYVLLHKPVIIIPVPNEAYLKDSVFDRLRKVASNFNTPGQLENLIEMAHHSTTKKEYNNFRLSLIDYSGCAAERYKQELYRMIGK